MSLNKKAFTISLVISIVALATIFMPEIFGLDGFKGGYAISTLSFFVFLSFFISAIVYYLMLRKETAIKNGVSLIAQWKFSEDEWRKFSAEEYRTDRAEKILLFKTITFFAIFFGLLFFILDPDNGIYVLYAMGGLILLMAAVAYVSIKITHQSHTQNRGEVFISTDGVVINNISHTWNFPGSRLENVTYNQKSSPKLLAFTYSAVSRYNRQFHTVRIGVPKIEENAIPGILKKFSHT